MQVIVTTGFYNFQKPQSSLSPFPSRAVRKFIGLSIRNALSPVRHSERESIAK